MNTSVIAAARSSTTSEVIVPARTRKLMARGAVLATATLSDLATRLPREMLPSASFFLGVGASGGAMEDLHAILAAAITDGVWSDRGFGSAGLAVCNPLLAFQLMNNFTMCHAAIHGGLTGSNSAFFSRGAGTVTALAEAIYAVVDEPDRIAIAGGADSAHHPVTWAELRRDGFATDGATPAEGCGLLALGAGPAVAEIRRCEVAVYDDGDLEHAVRDVMARTVDRVVITTWSRAISRQVAAAIPDHVARNDLTATNGLTLAALPALGWLTAIDHVTAGAASVLALSIGTDGALGVVEIGRPS